MRAARSARLCLRSHAKVTCRRTVNIYAFMDVDDLAADVERPFLRRQPLALPSIWPKIVERLYNPSCANVTDSLAIGV